MPGRRGGVAGATLAREGSGGGFRPGAGRRDRRRRGSARCKLLLLTAWRDRNAGDFLENPELMGALGVLTPGDSVAYRFALPNGREVRRRLVPEPANPDRPRFVLNSPRTPSAAISSVGYLEQAAPARVTILGETVGARLRMWTEGDIIELPNSHATILNATERHD